MVIGIGIFETTRFDDLQTYAVFTALPLPNEYFLILCTTYSAFRPKRDTYPIRALIDEPMDDQYDDRAPPAVQIVDMALLSVPGVHPGSQISDATTEARFLSTYAISWATRTDSSFSRCRVAIPVPGLREPTGAIFPACSTTDQSTILDIRRTTN